MKRRAFAYLLMLLLASTQVDDLWPSIAIRPLENTGADADGKYLPPACQEQGVRRRNRSVVPLPGPPPAASRLPILPCTAGVPVTRSQACPGPCLYVFMALLR